MSSMFAALTTASNALDVLEQAMGVVQNNVTNASTPGYASQKLNLSASAFNAADDLWGGVQADGVQSSRNTYAEESVRSQNELLGQATQQASSLSSLQSVFDVSGQSGIPAALSGLYSAFSAWSATPTDATAGQQVINAAQSFVSAVNQTASNIQQTSSQTSQQLASTVSQINQLSSQIAGMNAQIRSGGQNDAGLDANMYSTLEQLSNLANISVRNESDGTMTVLMDGQTPLVLGTTQTQLNVTYLGSVGPPPPNPGAPPDAHILTSGGQDVTSIVSGGQIAALLEFSNVTLPSVTGNGAQQGSLNQLAQAVADQVNTLLTSGQTNSGAAGTALFSYDAATPTSIASSLTLNPGMTAAQLAPVAPGPPPAANGVANQLAQLSNTGTVGATGMSYTGFYSSIASGVGTAQATAATAQQTQTQLVAQAQNMRNQVSGVSLNDQAAALLQFQQAYEAAAHVISTISNTSQYLLQMMGQLQG